MDQDIKEIIKAAYNLFPAQDLDVLSKYEISYDSYLRRVCLTTDGKNFTYLSRVSLDWSDTVESLVIDHMIDRCLNVNENYKIIRGKECVEYYRKTRIYSCMTGHRYIYSKPLFDNDNVFMVVNKHQRAKCYVNEDGTVHLSRVYSNRCRDYLGMAMWLQSKGFTVRQNPYHCHCIINHKKGDFLPYLDKLSVERLSDDKILITGKSRVGAYYTDGFDPTAREYTYCRRIVTDNGVENVYSNLRKPTVDINDALTFVDMDYCNLSRVGKTKKWCLKRDSFFVKDFNEYWRKDKLVMLNFHYEDEMYPKIYSVKTENGWIKAKDCIILDKKYHKKDLIKLSEKHYSGRARAENCSLLNGEIIRLKDYNKIFKKEIMNEVSHSLY